VEAHSTKKTLAFGVVTNDVKRRALLTEVCERLSRLLGSIVYLQVARSYPDLARAMNDGSVELAWTPPLVAAELVERSAIHVLVVSRRDNAAQYRSVIFSRRDSGIKSANDLAGKHMAWVDPTSASGYVVPCVWLRDNGLPPEEIFAKQSFLRTHGAVARAVLERQADAGATFALLSAGLHHTVEAGWTELDPASAEEVQMVVNAGTVPADCICVGSGLPEATRERIEAAFLGLDFDDLKLFRKALGAEGYERCPPGHARALRRLQIEAARATPTR
jgi:phosphonate transport system substrate-binding protein